MPHTVEVDAPNNTTSDNSFMPDASVVTYKFGKRGKKPPVTLTWHQGGSLPEIRPEWGIDKWDKGGMIMIGSKNTLITGVRPNKPKLLVPDEEWEEFLKNAPELTIPRVEEQQPVQEWLDAIKNDKLPGSNFDYSADLTEMGLIGVMAQRFNTRLKYDAKNMKVTNRPDLDAYIKEPVRDGWSYGENL